MFGPFSDQNENLLNLYLLFFRISFYKDKRKAEENLDTLFAVLNEVLDASEWNRILKLLAKTWNIEANEENGIVNMKVMKQALVDKILSENEEKRQNELFRTAEQDLEDLDSEM